MRNAGWFEEIICGIEALGLLRAPRRVEAEEAESAAAFEGEILIAGQEVTLRLVLDAAFPLTLPRFFLCPWNVLGFIPHVDQRGFICYADPEGLVIDRQRPLQVVEEAFERVVGVLTSGVTGQNQEDFIDEFDAYWGKLPGRLSARSMIEPSDVVSQVVVVFDKEQQLCIAGSTGDISAYHNGKQMGQSLTLQNGLYLPLEPGILLIPPHPDGPFWTVEEARHLLLSGLSDANKRRLQKLLKKQHHLREYVIVKLPRQAGGATLFGLRFDMVGKHHPLLTGGTAQKLVALQLQRLDKSYLIRRGGGNTDLGSKRVLLAGCGAVGGYLAFELARAGVQKLTIVDPDTLTEENSFRHVLGRRQWNTKKVEAMKAELEAQLPYVQVTPIASTIQKALAAGLVKLADYDLVILALGNPTVELEINEAVLALREGPALIVTWLEPLSIGGHALLAANVPGGGCFQCLYTSPDGCVAPLENRADFAASNQFFGQALSGCGSHFTQYGSLDALRTAALATQLAMDALTGKEQGNPLLSWKGEAGAFEAAGFQLSNRYSATADELHAHRYTYKNVHCRVCCTRDEGSI